MTRYRSYKFTDKHHSKGGIRSSAAAGISMICTLGALISAFSSKGNAGKYLAILGVIAIVSCCYGLFVGKTSFQEEECYHIFSGIGTVANVLLVIFWIAVAGIGFFLK